MTSNENGGYRYIELVRNTYRFGRIIEAGNVVITRDYERKKVW